MDPFVMERWHGVAFEDENIEKKLPERKQEEE